jgi:hypothetical protein
MNGHAPSIDRVPKLFESTKSLVYIKISFYRLLRTFSEKFFGNLNLSQ